MKNKYDSSHPDQGYRDVSDLSSLLCLSSDEWEALKKIQEQFPMYINAYYASQIDFSNPDDPLLKMAVPSVDEADKIGLSDTSGEFSNTVLPGLQHKYRETALILSTNRCAMYCRHCFRRRMVGVSNREVAVNIEEIAAYIQEHKEISNVLISGGDAFMNSTDTIRQYLSLLCEIPHLDCIRFGSRIPVVFPQRILQDSSLLDVLGAYSDRKKIYVVTQFNHPKEITAESTSAVEQLLNLGVPVRNQTVLLKGINDDAAVLGELLKQLTSIGVIPYYVFQCRPVTGVANHFQVPLRSGYEIVSAAMQMQSGLGKCFRYILSHETGKIEILGAVDEQFMLFKYHQAKRTCDAGRIFKTRVKEKQCWLDVE